MSHEIVLYNKGKGKGIDDPQQRKFTRRTVDYGSNVVRWLQDCLERPVPEHRLQTHYSYTKELMPPFATPQSPYDSICPRFVHAAVNKNRAPIYVVHWFPNGRRLLSGSQAGEMTIWSGLQFHSENVMQAHNAAIKAMRWAPEEKVLISGDQLGVIKYWDEFIYNFQTFQGHKESISEISIAPTGMKFCSCADESHAKVWDLRTGEEERAFTGHGWDVRCCAWHPTKGLVATGSKDAQIKLWDPRASEAITTIFCHKNTVTRVAWSRSGQWLASASKDQLVMLMDIRTMSVRKVFKAHTKEVTSLAWHPESDALLASGGHEGDIHFWGTQGASSKPLESIVGAHEGPVWSLAWHPLGHLLVSGSHDYSTRFWSRARPGDSNFAELLPKKIALGANDLVVTGIRPASADLNTIFEAGIFAELPLPPPPPEALAALLDANRPREEAAPKDQANPLLVPVTGPEFGLSHGGSGVLDTSDFDMEDHGTLPATAAAPTVAPTAPLEAPRIAAAESLQAAFFAPESMAADLSTTVSETPVVKTEDADERPFLPPPVAVKAEEDIETPHELSVDGLAAKRPSSEAEEQLGTSAKRAKISENADDSKEAEPEAAAAPDA